MSTRVHISTSRNRFILSPPLPSQAAAALGIPATAVAVRGSDSGAVVSIDGRQLLDAQKQAKLAALVAALEAALPVGGVAGELGGNAVASAAMLTQGACLSSLRCPLMSDYAWVRCAQFSRRICLVHQDHGRSSWIHKSDRIREVFSNLEPSLLLPHLHGSSSADILSTFCLQPLRRR